MNAVVAASSAFARCSCWASPSHFISLPRHHRRSVEPKDVFDFTSLRMAPAEIPPPSLSALCRRAMARSSAYRIYEFDRGPHPDFRSRLVLSRRRLSRAGRCPEPWRSRRRSCCPICADTISRGGIAAMSITSARWKTISRDLIRHLREQRLQRPDHARRPFQWWRFRDPLRRGRPGRCRYRAICCSLRPFRRRRNAAGNGGGWASLNFRRIYGLLALNTIGIHGFNGLPVIEFNKPTKFWTEPRRCRTPTGLNVSYHPRYRSRTIFARSVADLGHDRRPRRGHRSRGIARGSLPRARRTRR